MGTFLDPVSHSFRESLRSEIYVDKSGLIAHINNIVNTKQKYVCVSRPRRFGKTTAAEMLAAYYSCAEDTSGIFDNLAIAQDKSYREHLNRYHVIKLDMQLFMTSTSSISETIQLLSDTFYEELKSICPTLTNSMLISKLFDYVCIQTGKQFVFLIDEWDCVMRRIHNVNDRKLYLDYLRNLFKDQSYVALAYMTGILPVKKYGEHSTLNMFDEYSMIDSNQLEPYFGFTEEEVHSLCEEYRMNFQTAKDWYDGYHFWVGREGEEQSISMYSPRSVVMSMRNGRYGSYWSHTETYEALKVYIEMNFDGLRDAIVEMLAGGEVEINTRSFNNDMNTFANKNDVLTLLVHLGYLSYHANTKTVVIPNKEVELEFIDSIENIPAYSEVFSLVKASKELLQSLWNLDGETVAQGVEKAHLQFPSLRYNNENALSCTIELAFYYAREYYTIVREMPTGKGFADICFIPKPKHADKPAVIIELKWDKSVDAALAQIKRKEYPAVLESYQGNLLLCGINYDKDGDKTHTCVIEQFVK